VGIETYDLGAPTELPVVATIEVNSESLDPALAMPHPSRETVDPGSRTIDLDSQTEHLDFQTYHLEILILVTRRAPA
jgi:hypothetical protein